MTRIFLNQTWWSKPILEIIVICTSRCKCIIIVILYSISLHKWYQHVMICRLLYAINHYISSHIKSILEIITICTSWCRCIIIVILYSIPLHKWYQLVMICRLFCAINHLYIIPYIHKEKELLTPFQFDCLVLTWHGV